MLQKLPEFSVSELVGLISGRNVVGLHRSRYCKPPEFSVSALFGLIGVAIFGAKTPKRYASYHSDYYENNVTYRYIHIHWGFGLAATGCILALLCSILIAYSRVKHAAKTNLALAAAGLPVRAQAASAPGMVPMQPMASAQPNQPMQMPPGAPVGYYPYMPAYPYPYPSPYPYPPPAVTPLAAPPTVPVPSPPAPTPFVVTGAATQGMPTSQVPAFYVMRQGQLVPVYSEVPAATTASPATTTDTAEQTVISDMSGVDGQPSNRL